MPRTRAATNILVFGGLAALVALILTAFSHTDRARQNVLQAAWCLFALGIGGRQAERRLKPASPELAAPESAPLWPALLLGAAVWSPMIPLYFIGDDFLHLRWARAPFFSSIWGLARHGQEQLFLRPLGSATIFLDYRVWHLWPDGYHLTNLAIHLAGVAGLYLVCRELRFGSLVAAAAALLYAVMPIEAEAVAWLGARFDLMSACFAIWTGFFYFRFRREAKVSTYCAALVCFGCALLSKENVYLFPVTLLAAEWLVLPQPRLKPWAGFALLAAALFSYRWLILGGVGGYRDSAGQPIAFHAGLKVLQGLLVRDPALLLAGYNWSQPTLAASIFLSSLTCAMLLALVLAYRPGRDAWKRFAFSCIWIAVPLLPAHPLLLIQPDLQNARILYLAAAGMAMLVAHMLGGVQPVWLRWLGAAVLVCLYSAGTLHNLGAWRWTTGQEERLFSELKRIEPASPADTLFVFYDMPVTIRGVYFLQAGLPDAIRLRFGRDDLDAIRAEGYGAQVGTGAKRPIIRVRWTGKSAEVW